MAAKLFLDEQGLRRIGFSEPNIATLRKLVSFVDAQEALSQAQTDIVTNASSIAELAANDTALDGRLDAAETDITNLQTADGLLDNRIDAYDLLAPFVRQDQAAAPAYTPYAGQTVSNPPTQAEMQALDDAVKAQGVFLAALVTALQTINALT